MHSRAKAHRYAAFAFWSERRQLPWQRWSRHSLKRAIRIQPTNITPATPSFPCKPAAILQQAQLVDQQQQQRPQQRNNRDAELPRRCWCRWAHSARDCVRRLPTRPKAPTTWRRRRRAGRARSARPAGRNALARTVDGVGGCDGSGSVVHRLGASCAWPTASPATEVPEYHLSTECPRTAGVGET